MMLSLPVGYGTKSAGVIPYGKYHPVFTTTLGYMIKLQKKTKSETRTSFTQRTVSLFQKRSSLSRGFTVFLLLILCTPWSLSASERGSTNLTSLIKSLQLKQPYQTEALFNNIAAGTLEPEIVDRYSVNAALFLGIYALEHEQLVSAEKLFLYAAEKPSSELSKFASEEYMQLLGRQEKWQELINYFENHYAKNTPPVSGFSVQTAVLYSRALLEAGRVESFLEA